LLGFLSVFEIKMHASSGCRRNLSDFGWLSCNQDILRASREGRSLPFSGRKAANSQRLEGQISLRRETNSTIAESHEIVGLWPDVFDVEEAVFLLTGIFFISTGWW
jgi:hypothetical protein